MSDLERLEAALADLRAKGYVAEGALAETSSAGWDEVATMTDGAEKPRAVFWNTQSQDDSFDDDGMLVEDLPLQWSGDGQVIVGALRAQGFDVTEPGSERDTIVVHAAGKRGSDDELPGGYDIDVFHEVMGGAGWKAQWNEMLVEYVRERSGAAELRVRADPDHEMLVVDLAEGGDLVATREIPTGNRFREAIEALTAVPDDVTRATFEQAIEPVVVAAAGGAR